MNKFKTPITELIRRRTSWRKYLKMDVDKKTLDLLEAFVKEEQSGLFGGILRFEILSSVDIDSRELGQMTTYGLIKAPRGFIVGTTTQNPFNLEEFGYAMEKIVLYATELELSTCWLGGTFTRGKFAEKIALKTSEELPAVVSFGYPSVNRGLTDSLARFTIKAKKRLPWEQLFFIDDFNQSLNEQTAGIYTDVLKMVRLSPSGSNKQPWRIIRVGSTHKFHFFLERTKGYRKLIEKWNTADIQRVDMGIAMSHFELTARQLNLKGKWIKLEDTPPAGSREYIITWVGA